MAQPEQTSVGDAEAVAAIERPGDLERRPDRQNGADGPLGLLKHRTPEWHESAHARVLHDRQSNIAEFFRQGRLCACAQRIRLYNVDRREIELAPIFPITSTGGENGVVQ